VPDSVFGANGLAEVSLDMRSNERRGEVDDDEDASVPFGVDKGEWPDAERASTIAVRVERVFILRWACKKWTQCDQRHTWGAVKWQSCSSSLVVMQTWCLSSRANVVLSK
jgi:hypothetical protein